MAYALLGLTATGAVPILAPLAVSRLENAIDNGTKIANDVDDSPVYTQSASCASDTPAHLTHTIDGPRMVHVGYASDGEVRSLLIVAPDKTETLVRLRPRRQQTA
jgi:hypothetical protein